MPASTRYLYFECGIIRALFPCNPYLVRIHFVFYCYRHIISLQSFPCGSEVTISNQTDSRGVAISIISLNTVLHSSLFRRIIKDFKAGFKADIFRWGPYHYVENSRFYHPIIVLIQKLQIPRVKHKLHFTDFSGFKMDAFKSPQHLFIRSYWAQNIAKIQLYHLVACIFAGIFNFTPDFDRLFSRYFRRRQTNIGILKCRITQSITKRIKSPVHSRHIPRYSFLGTSIYLWCRFGRKIKRYLSYWFRKGNCELTSRIIISKQNVCHSNASLSAGVPGFQNSRNKFVCPINR